MKATGLILATALCAALSVDAAITRKLPAETVVEGESLSIDSLGASSVRSSNASVFAAALRESGEAVLSGARLGEARLDYVRDGQVFASRPVTVVPAFWHVLRKMFTDDPEITVEIVGDKVVVGGYTANVDTLRRVETAKALDPARIVTQVGYSTAQIAELVRDFLSRAAVTNVEVNVVGREVCLSGRMYDMQSIEQLKKRVEGFVTDFPGMTVNTDELRIYKQKIMINIEFVAYNDTLSRKLGFKGPESVKAEFGSGNNSIGYTRDTQSGSGAGSAHKWTRAFQLDLSAEASINLLKKNGAAKKLYATTLSTQSGIEAEFQNGGTIHRSTTPGMGSSGDMVTIEYGYIIKATPHIIDANTVNLDFSLDNKNVKDKTNNDIDVTCYQTKSKYLMRPGESIILSGYKANEESEDKYGTPWLSKIPWIGQYLFGDREKEVAMDDMLLVVTVDWALEDDTENATGQLQEMKDRRIEVEMP